MPDKPPPMNRYLLDHTGPTLWSVLRAIAIILLLVQAYIGIGLGFALAIDRHDEVRCGTSRIETMDHTVMSVAWPVVIAGAGVAILLDAPTKPCPVR